MGLLQIERVNSDDPGPNMESSAANNAKIAKNNNKFLPADTGAALQ
jgi:hypothetical protein